MFDPGFAPPDAPVPDTLARHVRRLAGGLVKAGVSVALIWWLIQKSSPNWQEIRTAGVDAGWLVAAFVVLMAQPFMVGGRFAALIRAFGAEAGFRRGTRLVFIMHFFNQFLPASVGGDAMRIVYGAREGVPLKSMIASTFMDRYVALLALVLLVGLGLALGFDLIPDTRLLLTLGFIVAAGIGGTALLLVAAPILNRLHTHFPRFERHLRLLAFPSEAVRTILLSAKQVMPSMGLSLLVHISSIIGVVFIARAFGADLSLAKAIILVPPVILALTLPISLGGWGVREATMVAALALAGLSSATALMISLTLGLLVMLTSLPGAWVWWAWRKQSDIQTVTVDAPAC